MTATRSLSFSRRVDASAEEVYDAVSDLRRMASWSPEYLGSWPLARPPVRPGYRFVGWNRNRWHVWPTTVFVSMAVRPHLFVFHSGFLGVPIARWSYAITPSPEGGCVVEEPWQDLRGDDRSGSVARFLGLVGAGTSVEDRVRRNADGMQATLDRLAADVGRTPGPT